MITSRITAIDSWFLSKNNTGLGNVLFQVATAYGLAKTCHRKYSVPDIDVLANKLQHNFGLVNYKNTIFKNINTEPVCLHAHLEENRAEGYDPTLITRLTNIPLYVNVNIGTYLQSHKYFDQYRECILNLLKIDNESLKYIEEKYPQVTSPGVTTIAVHIRQCYGGNVTYTVDDYAKMIRHIMKETDAEKYLLVVCSDDIEWCKHNLSTIINGADILFMEGNPDYIDLWVMSLCNHYVICHSTFGWWGAYLSQYPDKIVIYSEKALRRDRLTIYDSVQLDFRQTEHYFHNWIAM